VSPECKNLISRMLVTDPKNRASLQEIMNHPWMTKGFSGPPENYLPTREPVTLPLDPVVVQKMTGFDFGPPDYIQNQLAKVIESDDYQRAVRYAQRRQTQMPDPDRSRGMFSNFYKRRNSATSRDTLTNASSEAVPLGQDPINAYSPLMSIYYLVREKLEREKIEANPGALKMPQSPGEIPLAVPNLPEPPKAYTNPAAYEMKGESTGGRSRPRARTREGDEIQSEAMEASEAIQSQQQAASSRKESTAGALLRRISTRRRKPELGDKEAKPLIATVVAISSPSEQPAASENIPRKSYSVRKPRESEDLLEKPSKQQELLTPPANTTPANNGGPKRFMSLRRAASVDRRRLTRKKEFDNYGDSPSGGVSDGEGLIRKSMTQEHSVPEDIHQGKQRSSNSRTKSLGHARRESIQARRAKREELREQDVLEETDAELAAEHSDNRDTNTDGEFKPVFLKGLFSVSTTSNKSLTFIRSDIIRVLKQLNIEYREIRGGFSCWCNTASKDLDISHQLSPSLPADRSHRRKISLQAFRSGSGAADNIRDAPSPSGPRTPQRAQQRNDGSPGISDAESEKDDGRRYGRRDAGATSTHVRDEGGQPNERLDFEVFVVKVPLLSLHGIQFKKVDGNIMQYKNMAQRILELLKL
jgi:hypothetical protein